MSQFKRLRSETFLLILGVSLSTVVAAETQVSGEVSVETRVFFDKGIYGNEEVVHNSIVFSPEISRSWDNDRSVLSMKGHLVKDDVDDERSRGDLRELSFISSFRSMETKIGISKVFWGVTESRHLVDVINQTDLVDRPDGEEKMGQPMIQGTYFGSLADIEVFILPYFRERTFPGEEGRLRSSLVVNNDRAFYEDGDEESHLDLATRLSGGLSALEWGLSYFKGTSRDPAFELDQQVGELVPFYFQTEQLGVELEHIAGGLISKAEMVYKESEFAGYYAASTVGIEYTFSNLKNGKDIGILFELLGDSEHKESHSGWGNASFMGSRIAFNNMASSEILLGMVFDNYSGDLTLARMEASTRVRDVFSIDTEINIVDEPSKGSFLNQVKEDDFIELSISYHF